MLELLARPRHEQVRFSDVVRELGITQATAHAILKTLTDRGWVSRDPVSKTFTLGPALAIVAARTDTARPIAHAARTAARELHTRVGYPTSVVERAGDTLMITAIEGDDRSHPAGVPGDHIPFAPPFGVAFAAWDSPDQQRAWMSRAATSSADLTRGLERVLAATRDRGFDVDWMTPALAQTAQLARSLQEDGISENLRAIMDQLLVECTAIGFLSDDDPARKTQPIATIAAPVFDGHGRVALIIAAHPLRPLTARQIDAIGRHVIRATDPLDGGGA